MSLVAPQVARASGSACPDGSTKRKFMQQHVKYLVSTAGYATQAAATQDFTSQVSAWNMDYPVSGAPSGSGYVLGLEDWDCIDNSDTTETSSYDRGDSIANSVSAKKDSVEPQLWRIHATLVITETITFS